MKVEADFETTPSEMFKIFKLCEIVGTKTRPPPLPPSFPKTSLAIKRDFWGRGNFQEGGMMTISRRSVGVGCDHVYPKLQQENHVHLGLGFQI